MKELKNITPPLLIFICVFTVSGCSSSMSKKNKITNMKFMNCYESKINLVKSQGSAKRVSFEDCLDHRMTAKSREMKLVMTTINNLALTEKKMSSVDNKIKPISNKITISAVKLKKNQTAHKKPKLATVVGVSNQKTPTSQNAYNKIMRNKDASIPLPSLRDVLNKDNNIVRKGNGKGSQKAESEVIYKTVVANKDVTHRTSTAQDTIKLAGNYARANIGGSRWSNIVKGFKLNPHLNRKLVKEFIAYYAKNSKAVTQLSQRAAVFLPMIMEEINNRGMPMEIALLPFVESGFATKAVSSAQAAGLWQFIPETGKRYGLKKNKHYDGRFNPDAATTAALDYLQDLHQQFNGDWLLALAAYNAGENRVARAVAKQMKAGKKIDFWSLSLPKETRLYVPRLLAYRELIRRPDAYNIVLPLDKDFIELKRLRVAKKLNLQTIAEQAQLPKKDILIRLNPNFTSGKTQPKYERNILVPSVYYDRVRLAIHQRMRL